MYDSIPVTNVQKYPVINRILGEGGLIETEWGYTSRPAQMTFAMELVDAALAGGTAAFEKPMGTGKALAFLAAACELASRGKSVSIAPATTLESNQLGDEMRRLEACGGLPSMAEFKGRLNYACNLRARDARVGGGLLDRVGGDLTRLSEVEYKLVRGDKIKLPNYDACIGSECPLQPECYGIAARVKADASCVRIGNQFAELFFAKLRELGDELLRPVDVQLVDEGDKILGWVDQLFSHSAELAEGKVAALDARFGPYAKQGSPVWVRRADVVRLAKERLGELREDIVVLTERVEEAIVTLQVARAAAIPDEGPINDAATRLAELKSDLARAQSAESALTSILDGDTKTHVFGLSRRRRKGVFGWVYRVHVMPRDSQPRLRRLLPKVLVGASGTMPATWFDAETARDEAGIDCSNAVLAEWGHGDYAKRKGEVFLRNVIAAITAHEFKGGVLVLCASHEMRREWGAELGAAFGDRVIVQDGTNDGECNYFLAAPPGKILVATAKYGTGYNPKGDACTLLVIPKYPLYPDAWYHHTGPAAQFDAAGAELRTRQWLGRLVRQHGERGVILTADHRVQQCLTYKGTCDGISTARVTDAAGIAGILGKVGC